MKINDVYLVQRATMKEDVKDADVTGIDSAFSMDYMGSAEFEFGTLPKALKAIVPNLEKYQIFQHKALKHPDGRGIFVFCLPEAKDDLFKILEILASVGSYSYDKDKGYNFRLKESTYLDYIMKGEKSIGSRINLWWDLENHWFASLGKPVIVRLELALKRLKEKWKKEGKI